MGKHISEEAKRCFQCKNPKCMQFCPVNTPVNDMVKMLLEGKIIEAGEMLFQNNPLSVVCSLVCPHENQCEGNCIRGIKESPVQVSSIENYISDFYLNFKSKKPVIDKNKKVAIIGSGPAGITIAFILASRGYDITIYEAHDKIGGVLRYGIPEFRLPKDILEKLKEKLISVGVKIRPNILIGPNITVDDLFRDGFKAIFIGTGVWRPNKLNIKGETLGHVHYAIDYLKNPEVYDLGDRVCLIGAGNVAMDVARTALRHGSKEVFIMYRGEEEDITATKHELEYAKMEGVQFELLKSPVEIVDEGVLYLDTRKVTDENGKKKIEVIDNVKKLFTSDSVIVSISQGPKANIVSNTEGIDVDNRGLVSTDESGRTTREGIFASGDVVTGARTVVEAVKFSKKVAEAIDEYVTSLESKTPPDLFSLS